MPPGDRALLWLLNAVADIALRMVSWCNHWDAKIRVSRALAPGTVVRLKVSDCMVFQSAWEMPKVNITHPGDWVIRRYDPDDNDYRLLRPLTEEERAQGWGGTAQVSVERDAFEVITPANGTAS